jgi:hypothetical protein
MNPTTLDHALFAGAAYDDRCEFDNRVPTPQGAAPLGGTLTRRNLAPGFEAWAYEYQPQFIGSFEVPQASSPRRCCSRGSNDALWEAAA